MNIIKKFKNILLLKKTKIIESNYYKKNNRGFFVKLLPAEVHYALFGIEKAPNPCEVFDNDFYLENNPDIKNSGIDPFIHFAKYGLNEGRPHHPSFCSKFYLDYHHDVLVSGINPVSHYINHGKKEGRHTNKSAVPEIERSCNGPQHREKAQKNDDFLKFIEINNSFKIAVIFHVFHEDVTELCISHIKKIPVKFDLIITTPLSKKSNAIKIIKTNFSNIKIIHTKNSGRDIGPFISIWEEIKKYDLCLKLHTKKGKSDYINLWRETSLRGVLDSKTQVMSIIKRFELDKKIAAAGPEQLYGSLKHLVGVNGRGIKEISEKYKLKECSFEKHGFFMGSIFWFRPSAYTEIEKLSDVTFEKESGQTDGQIEHCIERILGTYLIKRDHTILLTNLVDEKFETFTTFNRDSYPSVQSFHNHFDEILHSRKNNKEIKGHFSALGKFDKNISGWLAYVNSEAPRAAYIQVNEEIIQEVTCENLRKDLISPGISSKGKHAFNIALPNKYRDGIERTYKLIDKASGKIVYEQDIIKDRLSDIEIEPDQIEWNAKEETAFKKQFLNMEESTTQKASIIMPTFNRQDTIIEAIDSVLNQSHQNWELIIIDDGSTDNTRKIVKRISQDERVKYKKIKNSGVSKARNIGINEAEGNFIFFLDSDNRWHQDMLKLSINYMHSNNRSYVYCSMNIIDSNNKTKLYRGDRFSYKELAYKNYIDLNCFAYKRTPHNENCNFDTSLIRLVDWDFILNITQNEPAIHLPFIGVIYNDGNHDRITNKLLQSQQKLNKAIEKIRNRYRNVAQNNKVETWQLKPETNKEPIKNTDVVITSYNHEKHISKAIESIARQKGEHINFILTCDDASLDSTPEIVTFYSKTLPSLFKNISVNKNLGISKNLRRAFRTSNTKYVAICEGDDFWHDDRKLSIQTSSLERNKNMSMIFNKTRIDNETTGKTSTLERQKNLPKELSAKNFLEDKSLNLIANFSSCTFRADTISKIPDFIYNIRFNEIVVAFFFDRFGTIGFINEELSTYRIHSNGVWSGATRLKQLESGLEVRLMALSVAKSIYREELYKIIESDYLSELEKFYATEQEI